MTKSNLPEHWLRGPVSDVPALLQPVAHALLQAKDEVSAMMQDFPDRLLWEKPAGMASSGFHLQHLCGVLDRLFTYAEGNALSEEQLIALKKEGTPQDDTTNGQILVQAFQQQVDHSVEQLKKMDESTLT
ncbi:MAG TPA: DinB family protein, partial [Flavisolibacter sp.]|nr:DinB family protein [Flavisolibacter sp.]